MTNAEKKPYRDLNIENQKVKIAEVGLASKEMRARWKYGTEHQKDYLSGKRKWADQRRINNFRRWEYIAMCLLAEHMLREKATDRSFNGYPSSEYTEFEWQNIMDWSRTRFDAEMREINADYHLEESDFMYRLFDSFRYEEGTPPNKQYDVVITDNQVEEGLKYVKHLMWEYFGHYHEVTSYDDALKSYNERVDQYKRDGKTEAEITDIIGGTWHANLVAGVFERLIDDPDKRPPLEDIEFIAEKWVEKFGGYGSHQAVARQIALTYVIDEDSLRSYIEYGPNQLTMSPSAFLWDLR